jgi:PAS domain S-box-containing protein
MVESIVESSTETVLNVAKAEAIRVLHVDDDPAFLSIAKQCLDIQGEFEVDTASSVNEALEKLEKTDYDAIVSDYQMPGKDGLEFLKELREKRNTVPFIVFTGKGREEIAVRALNLGADGYFNKQGEPETVYGELAHGIRQTVESKKAIEALRKSESKCRTLLENLPQKIFFKDKNSVYNSCNENYARELKIKSNEIAGRTDYDFYPKELAEKYRADDKRTMMSGNTEDIEEEYVQDGQKVFVHTVKTPVKDENGNVVGILGVFWDITERKKAGEALLKSEVKYRLFVQNLQGISYRGDTLFNADFFDGPIKEITGYSEEDLLKGKLGWDKLIHEEDSARILNCVKESISNKQKSGRLEYRIVRKDGTAKWISQIFSHLFDDSGEVTGSQGILYDITEEKKTEKALRQSEERHKELAESISDVFFAMDKDFRYTYWNKASEKLTGISAKDAIGKSLTEIFPDVKGTRVEQFYREALRTQQPQSYLNKFQLGGKDYVFEINAYPTKSGLSVFVKDITERRRAEELVRASEERYRSYIEVTGQLGWTTNANGEIEEDIPAWRKFTGQNHEEVKGWGWTKALHPDDLEHATQAWKKAVATKSAYEVEYRIRRYDGVYRNFLAHGVPVPDEAGSIREWVGTCIDITERKKAEEMLRESEEKLRNVFAASPDAITVSDLNGNIVECNQATVALHGYASKEELIGKNSLELIAKKDHKRTIENMKKTLEHGSTKNLEYTFVAKDGREFPAELSASVVMAASGKPEYYMAITTDVTERKKAEMRLRANALILENITDSIIVTDLEGRITSWNEGASKIFGFSAEEILGENIAKVSKPKEREQVAPVQLEQIRKGILFSGEWAGVTKDGEPVWLMLTTKLLKNSQGETVGMIGVGKDITKRKKAEEALRASENKFRNLFENANDAMIYLDSSGRILDVNGKTVEMFGGTRERLIGKQFTKIGIFSIEETRTLMRNFADVLTGKKARLSVSIENKKGQGITLECSISLVKTDEFAGIVVVARDLSERKKAEEELKSSEQKFRGLVEDSAASIAAVDLKGRLTYVNKALADSLGYSVQEMSGRAFKDFVHPDDRGNLVRLFLKIIVLRRQPRKFEFRALRKDGAILHFTCRPTRLETGGKTRGFQAIIADSTAEKHMLEKAEKLNEKLSVVGGLTRHDVNNKLSTILNVSYLLKQKLQDTQSLELVKATESAVHQVEGLFEFARTYEKLGTEELAYVDAENVFNEAARLFPSLKDIKIVNDCHGLTVFADSLLRQLFYNLVDNSLKHGEKVSQIRVHYQTDGDRVKLIYEDDGIGVPKAEKDKIFKEGYGKNSGHGLYMIKRICEVYGWTIQETGKQGKGAQFTIDMPKAKPDGRPNGKLG